MWGIIRSRRRFSACSCRRYGLGAYGNGMLYAGNDNVVNAGNDTGVTLPDFAAFVHWRANGNASLFVM